jgi:hypothetical protein
MSSNAKVSFNQLSPLGINFGTLTGLELITA